ncbi:disease resistance RPP13-like protein 4 [Corylus avellana]|uniref:disease resistance RPP13-like protein 4 n=1 Tax=Corylus avellana TaxID=13451 RepID=UPI00286C3EE0|nr:disease resistance RPP13-like protein 4 [Corylus avellana]
MELKLRIPLPYKLSSKESDAHRLAFQDFRLVYDKLLDSTTKLCLLCFALIPENEIVKKRFMTYWWVGEGFVSPKLEKVADGTFKERLSVEEVADGIFKELAKNDCIEPVNEKHSANFMTSYRACLVNGFSQELAKIGPGSDAKETDQNPGLDLEKLQTIFNVNEPYPDFFKLEWFSKLKKVKVLYLGRFFSLQGISRITKLPDFVCKLLNLRILDLRACHTLEELPDGIGSLKNLTHLDISECYLLDYIPKKIKLLSKLRVLKGFVIGDRLNENSCTLAELSGLKQLRKLSIYTTTEAFPNEDDENNLQKFENLENFTFEWGAFPSNTGSDPQQDKGEPQSMTPSTTS